MTSKTHHADKATGKGDPQAFKGEAGRGIAYDLK